MKGLFHLSLLVLCTSQVALAQLPSPDKVKEATRSGNGQYAKEEYSEAEASYKKALDIKNNMPQATFNLGDAVYEQKRFGDAGKQFELAAKTNPDPHVKAGAYHNLGNSYLQQKKWQDAVNAYKNALKINPGDKDTKYNLAYANAMLHQQNNESNKNKNQQNQKKDQQQKNDQQKKDQQQKDQQQKQDQQKKNGQQDQQQNKDQQQGSKQQPAAQPQLSKQEAEQLLQALAQEEKKTAQKVQKKKVKAVDVKIKKDW